MTWFALDDQGAFHAKVLAAGNEAYGAWCRAGQWCSQHLTDGDFPENVAHTIAKPAVWKKLLAVKFLEPIEGGYRIHDFKKYNPSREKVLADRAKKSEQKSEAGRKGGLRSGETRRFRKDEADAKQTRSKNEADSEAETKQTRSSGQAEGEAEGEAEAKQNEAPIPIPIPSASPKQKNPSGSPRARARSKESEIPDDWSPSDAIVAEAASNEAIAFDPARVAREAAKFRAHAEANGRRCVRWDAAFRQWLLKAREMDPRASRYLAPRTREPTREELETPVPEVQRRVEAAIARGEPLPQIGDLFSSFGTIGRFGEPEAGTGRP